METFKKYKRSNIAEMRPYEDGESLHARVSISQADQENGSPKLGDMIARNPNNHEDQWLVAGKYFNENFEEQKDSDQSAGDEEINFDNIKSPENLNIAQWAVDNRHPKSDGENIEDFEYYIEISEQVEKYASIQKAQAREQAVQECIDWYKKHSPRPDPEKISELEKLKNS